MNFLRDYWESGVFPTVEIEYIAVRKDMRGKHIGSTLIHYIRSLQSDKHFHNPRFISVSAYCTSSYSAVPFYQKCNFWAAEIKNPYANTLRMYRLF